MKAQINMIGIITNNFDAMKNFYNETLGFKILMELESYVEFKSEGVRFAISTGEVMHQATGEKGYLETRAAHKFELAFKCDNTQAIDSDFQKLIEKGAKEIKAPTNMPWGQRTAFFADPDGNIHELFCELKN